MSIDASDTGAGAGATNRNTLRGDWHVELSDGVCRMSEEEVDLAFREGLIGSRTLVLPPGTGRWAAYAEVRQRESSDPLLDSEPHARKREPELGIPSVPPMATDVPANRPWEAPPPRFEGAFGPGNDDAAEVRTRRLIFAGILTCALAGGFFAATGTKGIRALVGYASGHRAAAAAVAPPPPPAAPQPPPPPASASAAPSAEPAVAAPPPTGVANPAEPVKKPAKKKRRKPVAQ